MDRMRRNPTMGALHDLTEFGSVVLTSMGAVRDLLQVAPPDREYDSEVVLDVDSTPVGIRITDIGPANPGGAPEGADPTVRRRQLAR